MHTTHHILVAATSPGRALAAAISEMEPFQGRVYDYLTDWEGDAIDEEALKVDGRPPAISLDADPAGFTQALTESRQNQESQVLGLLDHLVGLLGYPTPVGQPREDLARYIEATFTRIGLACAQRFALGREPREDPGCFDKQVAYTLNRIAGLLYGEYQTVSEFYDPDECTARVPSLDAIADRQAQVAKQGKSLYLVPLDLHS